MWELPDTDECIISATGHISAIRTHENGANDAGVELCRRAGRTEAVVEKVQSAIRSTRYITPRGFTLILNNGTVEFALSWNFRVPALG
jgi:hypothetical protein